jgi:hypothetical protein
MFVCDMPCHAMLTRCAARVVCDCAFLQRAMAYAQTASPADEAIDINDQLVSPWNDTLASPAPKRTTSAVPEATEWEKVLAKHDLDVPLSTLPAGLALDAAFQVYGTSGRTGLLAHLKNEGVSALPTRQKLANAISKEARVRGDGR